MLEHVHVQLLQLQSDHTSFFFRFSGVHFEASQLSKTLSERPAGRVGSETRSESVN